MTAKPNTVRRSLRALGAIILLAALVSPSVVRADQLPVLLVIANQDFYYREYATVRKELAARGLSVVVAAGTAGAASPQDSNNLHQMVVADLTVADAAASDYSAIVFVGGWGASSYQYAFEGHYDTLAYRPDRFVAEAVNRLINEFLAQDKPVAALSHGVTVLAWARVDGVSPLQGRTVAAWPGGSPAFTVDGRTYARGVIPVYWHVIRNGGSARTSASLGDPLTSADDVVVDGRIITAENYDAAPLFARRLSYAIAKR